jgi:CRISPR-associated protein Cmr1
MPQIDFTLTLVSPAFLYGAYQRGSDAQPELRAQSVRGQLRYWLRAIIGAQTTDLKQVWDRESAVFGSTGAGSAVSVRVYARREVQTNDLEPMLPHREYSGGKVSPAKAISADQRFSLQLVTRPGVAAPADALDALKVWSLLGGLGKRSRRMFGAVRVSSKDELWYATPQNAEEFMVLADTTLKTAIGVTQKRTNIPDWPTLHPQHSWVVVGREAYDSAKEANQALFGLLRDHNRPYRNESDTFGFAGGGGRRASTLHAQVRQIDDKYYPVLTALRSRPEQKIKWDVLARFMKDAQQKFNGETVWGGW